MRNATGTPKGATTFAKLPMGAGGFITGISMSTNGATKVVRCDAHGVYVRGASDKVWRNMFLSTAIPAGLIHADHQPSAFTDVMGCAEAVVAPSDPTLILMNYDGYLLKSTDTGNTFVNTGAPRKTLKSNSGDSSRQWGKTVAVDPNNTLIILYGTQGQSIYYSLDGGTTFTDLVVAAGNLPAGNNALAPHVVACDPTSTQTLSIRQRWVYARYGFGVYMSTTGPNGTYALMTATPTKVARLKFDSFGTLWATQDGAINNIWKWTNAGGWINLTGTANNQFADVATDPANANNIMAVDGLGKMLKSADGGTTWPSFWNNDITAIPPSQLIRNIGIKYLDIGISQQWQPVTGNIEFDTSVANKLWCPNGVGLHYCTPPASSATQLVWFGDDVGVEELVTHNMLVPPGGVPLIACHDQGIIRIETTSRYINSQKSPYAVTDTQANGLRHPMLIQAAVQLDYASDNPAWIAVMQHGGFYSLPQNNQHCGYSTDAGVTWNMFPTAPPKPFSVGGGSMAVGVTGNVVILWNNNGNPVYTKDSGATWATLPIPGLPSSPTENGFEFQGAGYFLNKNLICYDKMGGAFYLFNYGPPSAAGLQGFWKSINKGDTWTQVYAGVPSGGASYVWHFHLRAVPGNAGHLFYTTGQGQTDSLYRSTNGGVAWAACTANAGQTITGVTDVGFGMAYPGGTYPSIYFFGQVGTQWGLHRSDDNLTTTTLLAAHPGGFLDTISGISGDMGTYGRVYTTSSGSGVIFGDNVDVATGT